MSTPAYRITFNFATFLSQFPEFGQTDAAYATSMFNRAQAALLDNTFGSPVKDDNVLQTLFFLLVAHLLSLYPCGARGTPGQRPAGNITSASQGSVSTSFQVRIPEGSAIGAWYCQTEYGLEFWAASAPYRSARYMASGNSGIGRAQAFNNFPFFVPGGINSTDAGGM